MCEWFLVGVMIVCDKCIIVGGYNGLVFGDVYCIDEGCYFVDGYCVCIIYVEMNVILQCVKFGVVMDGVEIYVIDFLCL